MNQNFFNFIFFILILPKIQNVLFVPLEKVINSYYIKIYLSLNQKYFEYAKINLALDFTFIPLKNVLSDNKEVQIFSENEIVDIDNLEYNSKLISKNNFYIDEKNEFNINNFKFYSVNKNELNLEEINKNNKNYANLFIGQIGLGPIYENDDLNLIHVLKSQNVINYSSFGISLGNKKDENFLFFGKPNQNDERIEVFKNKKFSQNINLDTKLLKKYNKWGIKLDALVIETNNQLIKHTRHRYFAYFNPIEDRIFVPEKIMDYIISRIFKLYIKKKICFVSEYNDKKFINCQKDKILEEEDFFPKIIFVIKKFVFRLKFEDLFIDSLNRNEMIFIIQKNYYDIDTNIICFGNRFFKKFIIEFDLEKKDIIFNSDKPLSTINLDIIQDDSWKDIIRDPNKEIEHYDTNYGNEGNIISNKSNNNITTKKGNENEENKKEIDYDNKYDFILKYIWIFFFFIIIFIVLITFLNIRKKFRIEKQKNYFEQPLNTK